MQEAGAGAKIGVVRRGQHVDPAVAAVQRQHALDTGLGRLRRRARLWRGLDAAAGDDGEGEQKQSTHVRTLPLVRTMPARRMRNKAVGDFLHNVARNTRMVRTERFLAPILHRGRSCSGMS